MKTLKLVAAFFCMTMVGQSAIALTAHFSFEPGQDPPGFTLPLGGLFPIGEANNTLPTLSTEKALSGTTSIKSYLHIYNSPRPFRSQFAIQRDQYRFEFGKGADTKDIWHGFAVWIPAWFPKRDPVGKLADQFHEWHSSPKPGGRWECAGGNPVELYFDQVTPTSGNVVIGLQGGQLANDCEITGIGTPRRYVFVGNASSTYTVGQWNTFVYNVRFDAVHGFFKLWINGKLGLDYTGPLYHNWSGPAYPIWGHYLDWWDRITNDPAIVERLLYYDDLRISDDPTATYATVDPMQGGEPNPPPTLTIPAMTNLRVQ
jgi:hypothetical protein